METSIGKTVNDISGHQYDGVIYNIENKKQLA